MKHKLVTPILKVIFPIMCTPPPSEGNEEIFDDDVPLEGAEASSPTAVSAQVTICFVNQARSCKIR